MSTLLAHAEILARFVVDETTGLTTIEVRGSNNEVGNVEGEEPIAVEPARMALRQHEGLGDNTRSVDMTEIGTRLQTIVTT